MVGGIVYALTQGYSPLEAARFGVAAGAAAVSTPGTELCRKEDVTRLYDQLRDEEADRDQKNVSANGGRS
jgi:6-phosphofructokinase 2